MEKNNIANALAHLYQDLRINPFNAYAYTELGRLLFKQARFGEAISHFERALQINPDYWEAHYYLANSLATQDQMTRAAAHYRAVIRFKPDNASAQFNLGLACLADAQYTEAAEHLEKTLLLTPNNTEAAKQLGRIYVILGKTEAAIHTYRKAIEFAPEISEVHHNLAILYLRNVDRSQALFHFQEALRLEPHNKTAEHMTMALSGTQGVAAPREYIEQLFDQYADYYDEHVKGKLKYQVPTLLRSAIGRCLSPNPKAGRVLDLGCGTGQCGVFFRDLALELIGIDLSPKMIEKAKALQAYEKLFVLDINEYLTEPGLDLFDLIIASDVFVYSGDLATLFQNITNALRPKGRFVFSIESHPKSNDYYLQPTGRFAHSNHYIHTLAEKNHFIIELEESIILREQEGTPIDGRLYVLLKTLE